MAMPTPLNATVCTTPLCHELSSIVRGSMASDYKYLDPCASWDRFVCDGFRLKHDDQPDRLQVKVTSSIEDEVNEAVHNILTSKYSDLKLTPSWEIHEDDKAPKFANHTSLPPAMRDIDMDNFALMTRYYNDCMASTTSNKGDDGPLLDLLEKVNKSFEKIDAVVPASPGDKITTYKPAYNTADRPHMPDGQMMRDAVANLAPLNIFPFVKYKVQQSMRDPRKMTIFISPHARTGLPAKESYDDNYLTSKYVHILTEFFDHAHAPHLDRVQDLRLIPQKIIDLETQMHEIFPDMLNMEHLNRRVETLTLAQLGKKIPLLRLDEVMLQHEVLDGTVIETVEVFHPRYLHKLSLLLGLQHVEIIRSYMLWQTFLQTQQLWDMPWLDSWKDFLDIAQARDQKPPPRDKCVQRVKRHYGLILDSFFFRTNATSEVKVTGEAVFKDLKTSFMGLIDRTKDLGKRKEKYIVKTDAMQPVFGYSGPDEAISKPVSLREYYAGAEIRERHETPDQEDGSPTMVHNLEKPETWTHAHDFFAIETWHFNKTWASLAEAPKETSTAMSASGFDVHYSPQNNKVLFPASYMRKPILDKGAPAYMNYGMFGSMVAKEMYHAFSRVSSEFGVDGRLSNKGHTRLDKTRLKNRFKCFDSTYKSIRVMDDKHARWRINWPQARADAMAETNAITVAHAAWKARQEQHPDQLLPGMEQFTPEQLFFIARSQVHCATEEAVHVRQILDKDNKLPEQVSTWMPLRDSNAWTEAFRCPRKTDKCSVFGPKLHHVPSYMRDPSNEFSRIAKGQGEKKTNEKKKDE